MVKFISSFCPLSLRLPPFSCSFSSTSDGDATCGGSGGTSDSVRVLSEGDGVGITPCVCELKYAEVIVRLGWGLGVRVI